MSADDFAYLEVTSTGQASVVRVTPAGAIDVMDLPAPAAESDYPLNVDALAIGASGELGVIRLPSGAEPASALDPALLLVPGQAASALAPWSTIVTADDPSCKSDPSGWRATIQTAESWLRLVGPSFDPPPDAPMLARVRWNNARVCVEAVEVRAPDVHVSTASTPVRPPVERGATAQPWEGSVESWVVAKFASAPSPASASASAPSAAVASRVGIISGVEVRQPLSCALVAR